MKDLKFYIIFFAVIVSSTAQAKDDIFLTVFISNSIKNIMNPIIEYCEINAPSTQNSINNGRKNYSIQFDIAFQEWVASLGDSKMMIPENKAKQMNLEVADFSNYMLNQVKQINANDYCSQLGAKLSNISKDEINAQFKNYEKISTAKSLTHHSSGTPNGAP